jgi:hypothetical protein
MKNFIEIENFDRRPDKSKGITREVWYNLLESSEEAVYVWCPKPDSLVSKTG